MNQKLNEELWEVLFQNAAQAYTEKEIDEAMKRVDEAGAIEHSEKYQKRIAEILSASRKQELAQSAHKRRARVMKAAVILLTCCIGLGVVGLSVDAVRLRIFNFFRSSHPTYTSIAAVDEVTFDRSQIPAGWLQAYMLENLPNEMYLKDVNASSRHLILTYANLEGDIIKFIQQPLPNKGYVLDTEDASEHGIEINGITYLLLEKDDSLNINWTDRNMGFEITTNLDIESIKPLLTSLKEIL